MNRILVFASICLVVLGSCNDDERKGTGMHKGELLAVNDLDQYTPPPAGSVIAADSMAVTDDPLNHFTFTVKIRTNEYSNKGTYAIAASFGPNDADGMFTMPRGGGKLKPMLKKGAERYTYIIGFEYQRKFYEYYMVSGSKGSIEIKNIKAYTFK